MVNGTFVYQSEKQAEWFAKLLASYNNTGKYLEIEIEEYSRGTTDAQASLFRAMVAKGADASGNTFSEMQGQLLLEFSPSKEIKDFLGTTYIIPKEVKELNQPEFQNLIEKSAKLLKEMFDLDFPI